MIRREKYGSRGITGCGHNYAGMKSALNKGICADFGNNVFHYGHKAEADQMRTPWEKLFQNIDTKYVQVIRNKLIIKNVVKITTPVHSTEVLVRHANR